MRKIIISIVVLAMAMSFIMPALGSDTDTINVTLNPQAEISILVDQGSWTPSCGLNETNETASDWANILNDGDVNASVTIDAANTEDWTIAGSATHNQFKLEVIGTEAIVLTASPQAWLSDLPDAGDPGIDFGLKVTMPTSSSTNVAQHVTITFAATAL